MSSDMSTRLTAAGIALGASIVLVLGAFLVLSRGGAGEPGLDSVRYVEQPKISPQEPTASPTPSASPTPTEEPAEVPTTTVADDVDSAPATVDAAPPAPVTQPSKAPTLAPSTPTSSPAKPVKTDPPKNFDGDPDAPPAAG